MWRNAYGRIFVDPNSSICGVIIFFRITVTTIIRAAIMTPAAAMIATVLIAAITPELSPQSCAK